MAYALIEILYTLGNTIQRTSLTRGNFKSACNLTETPSRLPFFESSALGYKGLFRQREEKSRSKL